MTEEYIPIDFDIPEDKTQRLIKVIGVGGGGCNAVKNMYNEGISSVSFAICNTDSQSLVHSNVPVKILLGTGLGAGGVPEKGKSEAEQNIEDIRRIQENFTDLIEYNDNTLLEQLRKVGYSIEKFMDFMTKIQRYVTDTISAYNLINQSIQQEMYILNKHLSIFRDTGNKLKEYDKDYETPMQ